MSILSVKNFSKTYYSINGEIQAIKDISFDIDTKNFIGIIGPSGCGKSSILNCISGLDKEYNGNIYINNSSIGYMFQSDVLFDWLTILDNATLGLKISKNSIRIQKIMYYIY